MSQETLRPTWRIRVGFASFVISIAWPILLPLLPALGVSAARIATFTGVMLVIAELLLLAGAAIAGKEGFAYIKSTVFGFLRLYGPPQHVSRTRYRIGLILFAIPILFGWGVPYFGRHLPSFEAHPLVYAIVGDMLLLASLFVLGGSFWEKLRALFLYDAHVVVPTEETQNPDES